MTRVRASLCAAAILALHVGTGDAQEPIALGGGSSEGAPLHSHEATALFPDDPDWNGLPLSALGLPRPRDWISVQDFEPTSFIADCTLAARRDRPACADALLIHAKRYEFAFSSAMSFLAGAGLESPSILGPVVTAPSGERAVLLFMRDFGDRLSGALAMLDPCDGRYNDFDASVIQINTRHLDVVFGTDVADLESGDPGTPVADLTGESEEADDGSGSATTYADVHFIAAHELAHALQYDSYRRALGLDHTCTDDRSRYVRWYVEGSAELPARRYLESLGLETVRRLDESASSFWGIRPYQLGIFYDGDESDRLAYGIGPFYQHLSERYGEWGGSAAFLDTVFPNDNYRPIIRRDDTLRWFDSLLRERVGTAPIGPTLALAFSDIASWPGTFHVGFPRADPDMTRWEWLRTQFNCSAREWPADGMRVSFAAEVAAYGGQCIEFTVPSGKGKAELMLRITAETAEVADALHLGLSDIVTGRTSEAAPARTVFSCAATLDESIEEGREACLPIREGPTRDGSGFEVRWVVPLALTGETQRVRLMLTQAPTRSFDNVLLASDRIPVGPQNTETITLAAALKRTETDAAQMEAGPSTASLTTIDVEPITRAFTAQDYNPFDFGDSDRSDPLSGYNNYILAEMTQRPELGVIGGPLRAFFFMGGDVEGMEALEELASGQNYLVSEIRRRAIEALDGDGTLMGFNVVRNRYTVRDGRIGLPMRQEERMMTAIVEPRDGWLFGPKVVTLDDLTEGAAFRLGEVDMLAAFGNNASREVGTATVLAREGNGVRLQLAFTEGPFAGVTAIQTLPFLEHRVRRRDREPLRTEMARFYDGRWVREVRERWYRPDRRRTPIEGETSTTPVPTQAPSGVGGTSPACVCSCDAFADLAERSTPAAPAADFFACADACCDAYAQCPAPRTEAADAIRDICTW